jgi:hypothetical protein
LGTSPPIRVPVPPATIMAYLCINISILRRGI